jgi:phospholipid-binding lipoprotein MlaA
METNYERLPQRDNISSISASRKALLSIICLHSLFVIVICAICGQPEEGEAIPMNRGRRAFGVSFFIFAFLICAASTAGPGCCRALAASEQGVEPEGSNGSTVQVNDPYEQANRRVFEFNDGLYFYVLKPVSRGYSAVVPTGVREAIKNGFHNLVFPSRFINFVLQGKPDRAANEVVRFLINSTLGVAGLFDFAQTQFGFQNRESDFGQTLALWGVQSGPFLMVPVLGPSDPRDLLGFGADTVMDPLFWLPVEWYVSFSVETWKFVNYTSLHVSEYEELKKASLDPYIAMRDAFVQYRAHLISER